MNWIAFLVLLGCLLKDASFGGVIPRTWITHTHRHRLEHMQIGLWRRPHVYSGFQPGKPCHHCSRAAGPSLVSCVVAMHSSHWGHSCPLGWLLSVPPVEKKSCVKKNKKPGCGCHCTTVCGSLGQHSWTPSFASEGVHCFASSCCYLQT